SKLTAARAISWPRPNRDVFARSLDRNLSIAAIALRIARVVTEQVLRAQLGRDGRKGLRQRADVVRAIDLPARSVGEILQITVGHQIELIEHRAERIVSALVFGLPRRRVVWVGPARAAGVGKWIDWPIRIRRLGWIALSPAEDHCRIRQRKCTSS